MTYSKMKCIALLATMLFLTSGMCQVRLPRLVSDGMVLQRDAEVNVWGWATPGEKVAVEFRGKVYDATTDSAGKWSVSLAKQKHGGPFEMTIRATNQIVIRDIVVGDVWVCSGQSNMELMMMSVATRYKTEIDASENKFIRQFAVPRKYTFKGPLQDVANASWFSANPNTVLKFSAVAYFFAKDLYDRYKVPIGLINATLGGSRTESWMSEDALKQFPEYFNEYQQYKDSTFIAKIESDDRKRIGDWHRTAAQRDESYRHGWKTADSTPEDWKEIEVPQRWNDGELGQVNGVVWLRKEFEISKSMVAAEGKLHLGNIVDADSTFVNGVFVGATGNMYVPRTYTIPSNLLKPGKNSVTVRVVSTAGRGGFVRDKDYRLITQDDTISLQGMWRYRIGTKMEPLVGPTFIMWKPGGLYNGMIGPILPYTIKGVIWYQGESNVGKAMEHYTLFPALIKNWRDKWQQGDFPFLFVQLPNFNEAQNNPSESGWAMFRESQRHALSIPNTGMAVAIDVGEWNDIHPANKKDVGKRLAVAARPVAYDERGVSSGPMYKSMKVKGKKVILSFESIGGGLDARGGALKCFAIAGADGKFVWATAIVKNEVVEVWSENIEKPLAVRYAWADNPEGANLYNKEGLPASPFRTDDFK